MVPNHASGKVGLLEIRSLREQVYEYLRGEMQAGNLVPGSYIPLNEISEHLGISKTPLRDAIIQLECEGFMTILPRRGVLMNKLSLDEIKNMLEVVGALESQALLSVFDQIKPHHLESMEQLNEKMKSIMYLQKFKKFDQRYYQLNIAFHDVFLSLSNNTTLKRIILPIKQRLYDFPRPTYIKKWEIINCDEHAQFIQYIKDGQPQKAARLWKDSHWSYTAHEKFIQAFYAQGSEQIQSRIVNADTNHRS